MSTRAMKMHAQRSEQCGNYWKREVDRQLPHSRDGSPSAHSLPEVLTHSPDENNQDFAPPDGSPPPLEQHDLDALLPYVEPLDEHPMHRPKRPWVTVEEVEDNEAPCGRFPLPYPGSVAEVLGIGRTDFEKLQTEQEASGHLPWEPFEGKEEWELSEWLVKRVNKTGLDEFLKLPIVHYFLCCQISTLMRSVDRYKIGFNSHSKAHIHSSRQLIRYQKVQSGTTGW
jgi:hypothetical protein